MRPKKAMANDGNYRERRWFTPWTRVRQVDTLDLPPVIVAATGQVRLRVVRRPVWRRSL